ncbi:MAG: transporter [Novosphingobium sp.]|nr:transporter [Novosphingobium sp.]
MRALALGLLLASALPSAAHAEDRDFCANRPGRGTPACTLAPGDVMLEVGAAEFDHSADALSVTDTLTLMDSLLRVGVTASTELQVGLGGYQRSRSRDRASGTRSRSSGIGDTFVALRHGLAGANGPVSIEAFVTLPTGKPPAGADDWGVGVLVPLSHDLGGGFQLALTPEADAAVNASGSGRHFAYGGVVGLSHAAGKRLALGSEFAAFEDYDPAGHALDARVTGTLAWQVTPKLQLDLEADVGVSHAAPKTAFLFGFARRIP